MRRKAVVLAAGLGFLCGGAGLVSDARPPERFQGNTTVVLVTVDDPDATCRAMVGPDYPKGVVIEACHRLGVIYMPNPCRFEGEAWADMACHEAAHSLGWSGQHER